MGLSRRNLCRSLLFCFNGVRTRGRRVRGNTSASSPSQESVCWLVVCYTSYSYKSTFAPFCNPCPGVAGCGPRELPQCWSDTGSDPPLSCNMCLCHAAAVLLCSVRMAPVCSFRRYWHWPPTPNPVTLGTQGSPHGHSFWRFVCA